MILHNPIKKANFVMMKKIRTILTALMIAAAVSAQADVKWLATTHDFGAFDEDFGPASTEFRFVNEGSAPVTIVAARASCGCTTPKYPREAIAPGDTATVIVTYDPAGRPGRFSKYVAVDISDNGRTKLYVKGTVVGAAGSVQARFPVDAGNGMQLQRGAVMFGSIIKGHTRSASVNLYNRSTDSISPSVENMPSYISMMMEPETVAPGEQGTAVFYFNSAKCPLYGFVNDTVMIAPHPGADAFPLPFVGIVEEDFSKLTPKDIKKAPVATLSETSVDFGKIDRSDRVSRSVTLRNEGKSPLVIRRIYSLDDAVDFAIDKKVLKPGKTATITVTVDTSKLSGALLNARGALITNDPSAPTQTMRLVGTF